MKTSLLQEKMKCHNKTYRLQALCVKTVCFGFSVEHSFVSSLASVSEFHAAGPAMENTYLPCFVQVMQTTGRLTKRCSF